MFKDTENKYRHFTCSSKDEDGWIRLVSNKDGKDIIHGATPKWNKFVGNTLAQLIMSCSIKKLDFIDIKTITTRKTYCFKKNNPILKYS
jgi:O-acetyl-ADP-ribose deacetylase (regulator of RNase III)